MAQSNYVRLLALADEVFATKLDPDQLDVNEEVIEQLLEIHPASVSEFSDENGPLAWLIVLPTSIALMELFLNNEITERELFDKTRELKSFDAIYLCSALVLEEHRRKGISKDLALKAISKIRENNKITALFIWAFSEEGYKASEKIARLVELPFFQKGISK